MCALWQALWANSGVGFRDFCVCRNPTSVLSAKFNGISYVAVASYKYCVERMSREEVTARINENVTYHPEIVREEMLF